MATFKTMKDDLTLLSQGGLVSADIGSLLNKCQREEIEAYSWSFLNTNVVIYSTGPLQTGTVTLTNNSTNVTSSGVTFTASMVNWYLWPGPTLTTPIIASFATSSTLTLSSAWQEATITTPFSFQPLYYNVSPIVVVKEIRQIDSLLMVSQRELNEKDPSRIATGAAPSVEWAPAPFSASPNFFPGPTVQGAAQVELWPRPAGVLPYIIYGKAGAIDMVNDADNPMLPSNVLEAKAMMYLSLATFANNGNPKWLQISQGYEKMYVIERDKAIAEDRDRVIPQGIPVVRAYSEGRPFDAAVDYNHDLNGPPYLGG